MVAACDDLEQRATFYSAIGAKKITTPFNGGELFPISADVDGLLIVVEYSGDKLA